MNEGSSNSSRAEDAQNLDYFFDKTTREFYGNSSSFSSKLKYNTKVHLRKYSGVKSFQCKFCHKSFRQDSTLNRHLRTHSGEKFHKCRCCNFIYSTFTFKNKLKHSFRRRVLQM